jgi:predicted DNA-binding transcriptional regulator AlpA
MQISKRNEGERLKAAIRSATAAAGRSCMVVVDKNHAHHFKQPDKDGNSYVVQDPQHHGVYHLTRADGTYVLLSDKPLAKKAGSASEIKVEVHIKGLNRKIKKKPYRLAGSSHAVIPAHGQPDESPAVCLIDINRVMRICGFKKSFIYEQPDFPSPVRLGTSRRAAVRWVESECILWAQKLVAKRSTASVMNTNNSNRKHNHHV